jgi:DNA-binding sugar fermentation-stimulating protein
MSQTLSKSGIKALDNNIIYTYSKLRRGKLVTRYQRFLADIDFDDGIKAEMSSSIVMVKEETVIIENETEAKVTVTLARAAANLPAKEEGSTATVVHCPNTGSMWPLVPPDNMYPDCACSTGKNILIEVMIPS